MNPKRSILRHFPLGQIVITPNALETLPTDDVLKALARHSAGDWGDLDEEDRQENELSLLQGSRLFSVYHTSEMVPREFWIITAADRRDCEDARDEPPRNTLKLPHRDLSASG